MTKATTNHAYDRSPVRPNCHNKSHAIRKYNTMVPTGKTIGRARAIMRSMSPVCEG